MGNLRTDTTGVVGGNVDKNKDKNDNKNGKMMNQPKVGGYASKEISNRERERQFAREFGRNIGLRNNSKDYVMTGGGGVGGGSQVSGVGGGRDFGRRKDNNGVGGGGTVSGGGLRMKDSRSKSGDFRQTGGEYCRTAPGDHRSHEFRQTGGDYRQQSSGGSGGNATEFRNQSGGEFRNSGDVRQQSADFKSNKSPGGGGGGGGGELPSSFVAVDDKDKLGGVRGVNIYPAQLKVAIKHMDSLPPRFLRRLQSGNIRVGGGSMETDQLLMSRMEPTIVESPSKAEDSPTLAEKERGGKSKQTQLQETKQSIRNLLGDLDQYTDEGVIMTPVSKDAGMLFPVGEGNMGVSAMPPHGYGAQGNVLYRPDGMLGAGSAQASKSSLFYVSQSPGGKPLHLPPTTRQRVLSCEELEKELLHSGGMLNSGGMGRAPPLSQHYPGEVMSRGYQPMLTTFSGNEFYTGVQIMPPGNQRSALPSQLTASSSTLPKKTKFSVNAPEFVSNRFSSNGGVSNVTGHQMTTESSGVGGSMLQQQYYRQAPQGVVAGGQQQHQFNVRPNSLMMQPSEFINIPHSGGGTNRSSVQSPYQLMPYDPSTGMGMIRNSPMSSTYMLPSNPGGVNMMQYHHAPPPQSYPVVPPYSQSSAGYVQHPQFTPPQFTPPQFTPPLPSFMQPNMVGGPVRWMVDPNSGLPPRMGSHSVPPPPPPLGAWYPPGRIEGGYGGSMYVRSNGPNQGMVMAPPRGGEEGQYVMVDPSDAAGGDQGSMMGVENGWGPYEDMPTTTAYEAGRHKVMRLLNEGNCVMVILIGGQDGDKMSLVR